MKFNKNAQGLPVNIVVMMIIGIIIFGIGFSMFSKFFSKGSEQIGSLSNQIKNDISNLECNSNQWICSPSNKMSNGQTKTFQIFIVNNDKSAHTFSVDLKSSKLSDGKDALTNNCGSVIIGSYTGSLNVQSDTSASIPFEVIASRVNTTPCSFVTTATLNSDGAGNGKRTSVIVRVE